MAIEIVDFPRKEMVIFNSYVKLPEGTICLCHIAMEIYYKWRFEWEIHL